MISERFRTMFRYRHQHSFLEQLNWKNCSRFSEDYTINSSETEHFRFPKKSNYMYSVNEFLEEPVIVTQMQTWYDLLYCVSNEDDETLWTSGEGGDIKCFDITTNVELKRIRTKSGKFPNDKAVDSNRNLIYTDGETRIE